MFLLPPATTDSGTTTWPYIATQVCEDMGTSVLYQSIAAMSKYSDFSFEVSIVDGMN